MEGECNSADMHEKKFEAKYMANLITFYVKLLLTNRWYLFVVMFIMSFLWLYYVL